MNKCAMNRTVLCLPAGLVSHSQSMQDYRWVFSYALTLMLVLVHTFPFIPLSSLPKNDKLIFTYHSAVFMISDVNTQLTSE